MNKMLKKPVSDALDLTLSVMGFWMLFSPAILHFNNERPENWLSVASGFIVIVLAFTARRSYRNWVVWLIAVIGAILVALPWIVSFNPETKAMTNAVICGVIIFGASISRWYVQGRGMGAGSTPA